MKKLIDFHFGNVNMLTSITTKLKYNSENTIMNKTAKNKKNKTNKSAKNRNSATNKSKATRKPGRPMLKITFPKTKFTVAQIVAKEIKAGREVSAVAVHNHVKRAIKSQFAKKVDKIVKGQGHPTYVFQLTNRGLAAFSKSGKSPVTKVVAKKSTPAKAPISAETPAAAPELATA